MAGQITCVCGELLVEEVDARGVRPLGSKDFMTFRRTTDYVMCASCFRSYNARELIAQAENADTIESLERLAQQSPITD
jgi:hypothetical protein